MLKAFIATALLTTAALGQQPAISEDPTGLYSFLGDAESVQITIEPTPTPETDWSKPMQVDGYVSREDNGRIVDHFFKSGSLEKGRIKFATKPIHSVWYEFDGRLRRGEASARDKEGYFVIEGKLIEHATDKKGKPKARTREVEFKMFPSLDEAETPPK
jgi:hypothetical protein